MDKRSEARYRKLACQACGLVYAEPDTESDAVRVGAFRPRSSERAVEAVTSKYIRDNSITDVYSYKRYIRSVGRADTLRSQARTFKQSMSRAHYSPTALMPINPHSEADADFAQWYSADYHTDDIDGYLTYLWHRLPELHSLLSSDLAALIPADALRRHTYVVGATGFGKSELLKAIAHDHITAGSAALMVLGPDGDFVEQIARFSELSESKRLVYVKPNLADGYTPVINPLEISGISASDTSSRAIKAKRVVTQELVNALEEVFGSRQGSTLSNNMVSVLKPCVLALLYLPGATLKDLQAFMTDGAACEKLVTFGAQMTWHKEAAEFFQAEFNNPLLKSTKTSISGKLRNLFTDGAFGELTCGKSTIDLEHTISNRQILLFNLSKGALGSDAASAFGRLVVAMAQGVARRREKIPESRRPTTHLLIDECHNFVTPSIEEILKESRKYRLHATLCQQTPGDGMGDTLFNAVKNNTNVQIASYAQPGAARAVGALVQGDAGELDIGEYRARIAKYTFAFRGRKELLGDRNSTGRLAWNRTRNQQLRLYYRALDADPGAPLPDATEAPSDFPSLSKRKRQVL